MKEKLYEPELAKEWILKTFVETQFKFSSLHYAQSSFSKEKLHRLIYQMDNIQQLQEWMIQSFRIVKLRILDMYKHSTNPPIIAARRYVYSNIDKKITLEEVAKVLHLNPSYFSRLYKKETNETFIEYVIRIKMEHAKKMLEETTKTVDEISTTLGYDNKSYFIKLFRNFTGKKPNEYRKSSVI